MNTIGRPAKKFVLPQSCWIQKVHNKDKGYMYNIQKYLSTYYYSKIFLDKCFHYEK